MPDSEAKFRALLEAAPDAIVGVNTDGRIVLVNSQTEALFGYPRDQLLGQPVEMLVPEAARAVHPHHRDGYFTHPITRPMGAGMELAGRRRDGSEFPAEISLSAIDTEDGPLVSAAVRDVTERKQAAIIASSNDAIISKALDGTITSWNPAAERLYGYPAGQILGRNVDALFPAERREHERRVLALAASGVAIAEYETTRVRFDGSLVEVSATASPITDGSGTVVGISTIGRDITERKRAARERDELEARLHQAQRLESLGQLAGGVAHDFNNLLAVILNYASFVAEELGDNEAARADVEAIRAAAERAARLTHQLLIFARRETVQPEVLELNAVVSDIHALLSRTLGEHVQLRVSPGRTLPSVRIDRGQLEQVVVNLAVNARDAMPDGGSLLIETTEIAIDDDYARLHPPLTAGDFVQLSVSDTGTGMTQDVAARAFEPFFSTKPKGEGSGLGLATVYGIVGEAGGGVSIYSEPGLGTTVRVYLPALRRAAPAAARTERPKPSSGEGRTVFVVEDEPAMRDVTVRILRRNGYAVVVSATAREAIAAMADHESGDLLLTDVVMPGMSGPELAATVHEMRPELPVLFMSGYSQGVLGPQNALDENVRLIQKPFTEEALLEQVDAAISAVVARRRP
jgi:PAS domain S-box-containing protein